MFDSVGDSGGGEGEGVARATAYIPAATGPQLRPCCWIHTSSRLQRSSPVVGNRIDGPQHDLAVVLQWDRETTGMKNARRRSPSYHSRHSYRRPRPQLWRSTRKPWQNMSTSLPGQPEATIWTSVVLHRFDSVPLATS